MKKSNDKRLIIGATGYAGKNVTRRLTSIPNVKTKLTVVKYVGATSCRLFVHK